MRLTHGKLLLNRLAAVLEATCSQNRSNIISSRRHSALKEQLAVDHLGDLDCLARWEDLDCSVRSGDSDCLARWEDLDCTVRSGDSDCLVRWEDSDCSVRSGDSDCSVRSEVSGCLVH
jgi:hypothetical protein